MPYYLENPALIAHFTVTPAVNPRLELNYDFSIFSSKVDPFNLKSQTQAKNIPMGLPSSPIKIWGKSVQGFDSWDGRISKQTEIIL